MVCQCYNFFMTEREPGPAPASAAERLLLRAAADGDTDGVRALLAEGAPVDATDQNARTPLILATFFGHYEVVKLLLAAGARAELKDDLDATALSWALSRGFTEIAKLLQETAPPKAVPVVVEPQPEAPAQTPREELAQTPVPAAAASPAPPPRPRHIRHCPVCGRTYEDEVRAYCTHHPALLVEGAPSPPSVDSPGQAPEVNHRPQHRLWAMMVVAFLVGGAIGSVIYFYTLSGGQPAATPRSGAGGDYPVEITSAAVVGGALKGREISLPAPTYPEAARGQRRTGSVTVAITVDGSGRVIDARALDGPQELLTAAEEAARGAKFTRGLQTRRSGTVKYDFGLCRADGECAQ
jgi:TonB family protein